MSDQTEQDTSEASGKSLQLQSSPEKEEEFASFEELNTTVFSSKDWNNPVPLLQPTCDSSPVPSPFSTKPTSSTPKNVKDDLLKKKVTLLQQTLCPGEVVQIL